jgi:hypothetical protein
MGPQLDATFTDLLQEVEDCDRGLIIEPTSFFGLKYRCRSSMLNQSPKLIIDYAQQQLANSLQPVSDIALVRNQISLTRQNGGTFNATQNTGPYSIQEPPNGVGPYPYSLTVNCYADSQLSAIGGWMLTVGTVTDYRYTDISLVMSRPEVAALFSIVPTLDCGDFVQIVNAPETWLPSSTINQLAYSFTETINTFKWQFDITGVPESEYTGTGFQSW